MPSLSDLLALINKPVVSDQAMQHFNDTVVDPRSLDQTPQNAQLHGFAAGALDGLRKQITPLNLAMMAGGPALRALRGGAAMAAPMAEAAPELGGAGEAALRGLDSRVSNLPPDPMQRIISKLSSSTPADTAFNKYVGKPWQLPQ